MIPHRYHAYHHAHAAVSIQLRLTSRAIINPRSLRLRLPASLPALLFNANGAPGADLDRRIDVDVGVTQPLAMSNTTALPSLVPTVGMSLLGNYLALLGYGSGTQQVLRYIATSWQRDPTYLKSYVISVWLLTTAQVTLICHYLFTGLIVQYGNAASLEVTNPAADATTTVTGCIILFVHLFYARRLWILSGKNIVLVGIVLLLAALQFILVIVVTVKTIIYPAFSDFHAHIFGPYLAVLAVAAVEDVIIAAAMWYLLTKNRGTIRRTDVLITRIITFCVVTGAITSIFDIIILICFTAMPQNLVYLAMYDFLPHLYVLSFLTMLNGRESLKQKSIPATVGYHSTQVNFPMNNVNTDERKDLNTDTLVTSGGFTGTSMKFAISSVADANAED